MIWPEKKARKCHVNQRPRELREKREKGARDSSAQNRLKYRRGKSGGEEQREEKQDEKSSKKGGKTEEEEDAGEKKSPKPPTDVTKEMLKAAGITKMWKLMSSGMREFRARLFAAFVPSMRKMPVIIISLFLRPVHDA